MPWVWLAAGILLALVFDCLLMLGEPPAKLSSTPARGRSSLLRPEPLPGDAAWSAALKRR